MLSDGCSLGKRNDNLGSRKRPISELRQQATSIVGLGDVKLHIGKDTRATGDIERGDVVFARLQRSLEGI